MSDLVGNPKDRFSRVAAQIILEAFLCQAHERVDVGVTFTAMPLTINISPPNIYFSFNLHCIIDEIIYLLNIIFIDIFAYKKKSIERAFCAEKPDIQHIYLPLELLAGSQVTKNQYWKYK